MSFLKDFIHLSSGNECPEPFLIWSGLSLISTVAGKKIWTFHGDSFSISPNLYVCMVGTPGSGKSTAMEQAESLFLEGFSSYLVSESIQSREDILRKMTDPVCLHTHKLPTGKILDWSPFYCIVDEMENFVSVDDKKMVGMLVGIYSRPSFGTGFKGDVNPNQRINNPYFSLLACTVPDWMMSNLRLSLFVGGLGRRLIIVHCNKTKEIDDPRRPLDYADTRLRLLAHLKLVEKHGGELKKTPAAIAWWKKWYYDTTRKDKLNQILIQFHETQHIQLLKVATALSLCENPQAVEIDEQHLEFGYHLLRSLERDVVRLTSGIGRNELAGIESKLLDQLELSGGLFSEKLMHKQFNRDVPDREWYEMLDHLQKTDQLRVFSHTEKATNVTRTMIALPPVFEKLMEDLKKGINAK